MALTFVANAYAYSYASTTTLDASGTLHVEVGDILVGAVAWDGGDSTIAVATTAPADSWTMLTKCTPAIPGTYQSMGYVVVGTHNATATIRATLGTSRGTVTLIVFQFRPDSGDTISLAAGPNGGAANSGSTQTSGNISPSLTDGVVVGASYNRAGVANANEQIADSAATAVTRSNRASLYYTLFTSDQTNIHAQSTFGDNDSWVCDVIAIESAAASGGTDALAGGVASVVTPTIQFYRNRYPIGQASPQSSLTAQPYRQRFPIGQTTPVVSLVAQPRRNRYTVAQVTPITSLTAYPIRNRYPVVNTSIVTTARGNLSNTGSTGDRRYRAYMRVHRGGH